MPPVRSRSKRHRVAILRVDARLDPRVRNSHRAPETRLAAATAGGTADADIVGVTLSVEYRRHHPAPSRLFPPVFPRCW